MGRSPGDGNGNPLQCSCLENPMDGGAWWATVHGVAESQTRLNDFTSLHINLWLLTRVLCLEYCSTMYVLHAKLLQLCPTLFSTPWTVARQPPLSMRFSRQEYWHGLSCPPPGIFLTQGSNLRLLGVLYWQVGSFTPRTTWEAHSLNRFTSCLLGNEWHFNLLILRMHSNFKG